MNIKFEVEIQGPTLGDAPVFRVVAKPSGVFVYLTRWDDGVERGLSTQDTKKLIESLHSAVEKREAMERSIKAILSPQQVG